MVDFGPAVEHALDRRGCDFVSDRDAAQPHAGPNMRSVDGLAQYPPRLAFLSAAVSCASEYRR